MIYINNTPKCMRFDLVMLIVMQQSLEKKRPKFLIFNF